MTIQMSEDYKSGFKQGVVSATRLLGPREKNAITSTCWPELEVQNILDQRRTELLTRKVTKWVKVYRSPGLSDPASEAYGRGLIFDSKEATSSIIPESGTYLGTYPIEIDELY